MKKINLLIVTGMSGAGKSVVLNSLEAVSYTHLTNKLKSSDWAGNLSFTERSSRLNFICL